MNQNRCPKCQSEDVGFSRECYEDSHMEMIEDYLYCNDCGYDERDC